ncbi:hypothetical protein M406DRAFT_350360 [Cryphonectria parasitica EP155]|uniref:Uncharacterized protein n=1 Tax=Cryphonectria parasitica (strain ATCC 38755 / EP155) TaxID=660469 RepID=A0A9P5CPZ5_CRYP1|nr:uncharacterized protein M406DRAFT_350360 [Cryphonectria parasitica EP155]KAF3766999.1 hypothetical protein M406DRAFT_350360 [Cryphonectria parasitica EP155]
MPPKRGRGGARGGARGASRARGTPGPSTVDDTREATPVVDPTMRSRRTPAPSRFSSSYGSPVVLNSSRNLSGGSARSAIGAALETIKTANEEDLQQSDSDATGRSDDHDDNSARGSDDDTRAMPPPPLPIQRGLRGRRAGSVQPVSLFDGGSSPQTRFGSEPPYSDAMSQRSFVEESQIYSGADFATPRRPRATGPDRSRQSPATRSSARLAAKNSAARSDASVTPSPPRPGANTHARVPPPMSDSIDENDEEDPLLNPTPRGLPARKGSVDAASPDLSDRMRRARAARGPRLLSESDRGDSSEDSDVGPITF